MQATHGSTLAPWARGRLVATLMVLSAVFAVVLAVGPGRARAAAPATTTYLALGDSISYGYSEERFNLHFPQESPSYFEEGVANRFAKDLGKSTEVGKSIRLVNDACPGETSNGLIGEDEELGGQVSTESIEEVEGIPHERFPSGGYQGIGDWHPCKWTYVSHLPLHNGGYINGGKEVSQLEDAVSSISNTHSPVKAITLNIGSNDELAAVTQCKDELVTEPGKWHNLIECLKVTDETVLVPHILHNIGDILTVIDHLGYTGPIVVLGFYNPDAFILEKSDELQEGTNVALAELASHFANVTVANPFPVFNKGAGVKQSTELKSICKYTEMCNPNDPGGNADDGDIHPSPTGYKELAKLVNAAYMANPAK